MPSPARRSTGCARGIESLNADIVYGLPHQTNLGIGETVQKVLSLNPDRIALFGYAHVPWMAKRQSLIPTDSLPDPEARLALFDTARNLFTWDGFDEIGIDHFARPTDGLAIAHRDGTMRRNFQGYTEDTSETLIGLGASAISRYRQGYAQNAPATSAYLARVRAGGLAICRGHALTTDDLLRGAVIEAFCATSARICLPSPSGWGKSPRPPSPLPTGWKRLFQKCCASMTAWSR